MADRNLGQLIKDKVKTIDRLTDLDNTKRMLARGAMAVENLEANATAKQYRDMVEQQAKVETIRTLEANQQTNAIRHDLQQKIKE